LKDERAKKDHIVRPPDPCGFRLHYERTPRGDLVLKLELVWDEDDTADAGADKGELIIS
jgi:hypothetical protein